MHHVLCTLEELWTFALILYYCRLFTYLFTRTHNTRKPDKNICNSACIIDLTVFSPKFQYLTVFNLLQLTNFRILNVINILERKLLCIFQGCILGISVLTPARNGLTPSKSLKTAGEWMIISNGAYRPSYYHVYDVTTYFFMYKKGDASWLPAETWQIQP